MKHLPFAFREAACKGNRGTSVGIDRAATLLGVTCCECCRMVQRHPQLFAELLEHARAVGASASAIELSQLIERRSTAEYAEAQRDAEAAERDADELRDEYERASDAATTARNRLWRAEQPGPVRGES